MSKTPVEPERKEDLLFQCWSDPATDAERDQAIGMILGHLGQEIWRTNITKHGNVELEMRAAT